MKLTKKEVLQITTEQNAMTDRPFYLIPVWGAKTASTTIRGQQFWAVSEQSKRELKIELNGAFFFFRTFADVKHINNSINL